MASYNRVILMGNLTRDPEMRQAGSSSLCRLGLAVNRRYRDGGGEMREEVTYVDVEVWGRQAETCNQYLRRGAPALIEGRLRLDQWDDRNSGQRRSKLVVVGERVQFLGGRNDSSGGGNYNQDRGSGNYNQDQGNWDGNQSQAPQQQTPKPAPPPPFPEDDGGQANDAFDVDNDDSIDDIPF